MNPPAVSTTALSKLKEQAEINALRKLQTQFSTPDQLEQIEQHLGRSQKRTSMVEVQLKSAIQSHFISVNSCMEQLKEVSTNVGQVRGTIYSIKEEYNAISHLEDTLGELRREANRHKQIKAAKENVKNILSVDDLSKKAHEHLEKNQLLMAHKCITDMEKCRNDILEELGTPSERSNNISDIKLVEDFFKRVKELQLDLHNNIMVTVKRMLDVCKLCPEQLVTALRIIEREEILDEDWKKKKEEKGFAPPDRPKGWRKECKNSIRELIENTIKGCRIEERDTNESWFSKHLGNICSKMVEILEVVKLLCEPCFPPSYKIFEFFVENIQDILSQYLKELIDTNQLAGLEYFVLLTWNDTYKSQYFMGHPSLKYDTSKLKNVLDDDYFNIALNAHIAFQSKKISTWFQNAMEKNFDEWQSNVAPHLIDGNFESSMPNDINTMLVQQLELINHVNDERFSKKTLEFTISELNSFVEQFRDRVYQFKANHLKNPEILKNGFIVRLVSCSNDAMRLREYFLNIRDRFDTFMDKDEVGGPNDLYKALGNRLVKVAELCTMFILEDMVKCLDEQYFKILLSRDWLTNEKILTTIIETTVDYMNDLVHLKPESQLELLYQWHIRIKAEYMKGFFQNMSMVSRVLRKCQFSDPSERTLFYNKMSREISTLESWFKNATTSLTDNIIYDFETLRLMSKIIKADDVDFMGVEVAALVKKCPDMTTEMLYALLTLRGDINKNDYKDKFEEYITQDDSQLKNNKLKGDEAMQLMKKELKIN